MYKLMEKRDMNEVENQFKVEAFNEVNSYMLVCFCAGVGRRPHHCVCMYVFIYVEENYIKFNSVLGLNSKDLGFILTQKRHSSVRICT